jgi:DNA-binding MarR family transcriptional regulator
MPTHQQSTDVQLATFADVILELAHQLDLRKPELRDVVPLTGTEMAVIRQIHRTPHSTPSQVADATGLRRSNVSIAVRTLEARGLVVRTEVPGNAKSVLLVPTKLAIESINSIHAYWASLLRDAPPGLLTEAIDATEALQRLAAAVARR